MNWLALVATLAISGQLGSPSAGPIHPGPMNAAPAGTGLSWANPAAPAAPATQPPRTLEPTDARELAPVTAIDPRQKAAVEFLVAGLLTVPTEIGLQGQNVTLLQVLGPTSDRQQQRAISRAYWRLASAVAELHIAWKAHRNFEQLLPAVASSTQPEAVLELETRLTSARAAVQEARLQVREAQYALAEATGWPTASALPLPADTPHVGDYSTRFDRIFAGRIAPTDLQRIERTLPLQSEAIITHGKAVSAAADAMHGARDGFFARQMNWRTLADSIDQAQRAEQSLMAAVLRYNRDIADYALAVAPLGLGSQDLVGMLIKRPQPTAAIAATRSDTGISPATFDTSIGPVTAPVTATPGQPTRAPERGQPVLGTIPLQPTGPDDDFGPREARRPHELGSAAASVSNMPIADSGLYAPLGGLSPARRAQELAELLHWDRSPGEDTSAALSLTAALESVPSGRLALVVQYWQTRQAIAQRQVLQSQFEQLDALQRAVIERRDEPGMADAMLRVEAARQAAKALWQDARSTQVVEQARLTKLLQQQDGLWQQGDVWPLPSSAPHGGSYRVLESSASGDSLQRQRLSQTIPAAHQALTEQATAVVLADAACAASLASLARGTASPDDALLAIARQTQESLRFLERLTAYNDHLAAYALAVMPQNTPARELAKTLVLQRAASR